MIKDCNSVLSANPDMTVLGCLWHQGENDVGNWSYPAKLDKMVKDLRNDLVGGKGANMPFLCGTMLANSFTEDHFKPAAELVNAVMVITAIGMGADTLDKFTSKKVEEPKKEEELG